MLTYLYKNVCMYVYMYISWGVLKGLGESWGSWEMVLEKSWGALESLGTSWGSLGSVLGAPKAVFGKGKL